MAPVVPLSRSAIAHAIPLQALTDLLDHLEAENDIEMLLDFLQPFYPDSASHEPLQRTKAARRCLQEKNQQLEFVRLCTSLIRLQFQLKFAPVVRDSPLAVVMAEVLRVHDYYMRQLAFLHLSRVAKDLFIRGIKVLFSQHLLAPQLVAQLHEHVRNTSDDNSFLKILASVGMIETVRDLVVKVTVERLCENIVTNCAGVWSQPVLQHVQQWVRVELYPGFAQGVFELLDSAELVQIAHEELVSLRIGEIYQLVDGYPHTAVALNELYTCLHVLGQQAHHRAKLVDRYISSCTSQLLHLGANTVDVVTTYTKTIKAFLIVDPTGVLLDKVVRPVRRYLKTRPDLVPQLVKGMLDTTPENPLRELASELRRNRAPASAPVDDLTDVRWVPDPIDALPDFKRGKVSDVVEALVLIFDLPSVFVDEFTRLFGDRLLRWDEFRPEDVVHHVELLKTRFGSGEFTTLDVMIRDIHDSEIVNKLVGLLDFSITVLSQMYWPTVCESLSANDYFQVPIEDQFQAYGRGFSATKKGRGLKLVPSLGTVKLELEFEGGSKEYNVTPAQATAISLFSDESNGLSLDAISKATGMSDYPASQALAFWVKEGVLKEQARIYQVVER